MAKDQSTATDPDCMALESITRWLRQQRNYQPIQYKPWPAHSDEVARHAGWGGMLPNDDVSTRACGIKVINKQLVAQRPLSSRYLLVTSIMLVAVGIFLTPIVIHSLVFEIPSHEMQALKQLANEIQALFYGVGLVLFCWSVVLAAKVRRTAVFDRTSSHGELREGRFFGVMFPKRLACFELGDIRGIQLIHYRAKHTEIDDVLIDQYEMNLVTSTSERIHLDKHPNRKAMLGDARKLAAFLDVKVWDRSQRFAEELVLTGDPLIQSL